MRNKLGQTMACLLAVAAIVSSAGAAAYDFDSAGDLDMYFDSVLGGNQNAVYAYGESAGINGSGAIVLPENVGNSETRYEKTAFDTSLSTWTMSVYFKHVAPISSATAAPVIGMGIASDNTSEVSFSTSGENAFLSVGIAYAHTSSGYRLGIYSCDGEGTYDARTSSYFTMTDGQWYYLEATFTANAVNDRYDVVTVLKSADADGTVGEEIINRAYTGMSGSDWLSADGVTANAFLNSGASARSRGISAVDEFVTVPEPSSMVLMLVASGALQTIRKRR